MSAAREAERQYFSCKSASEPAKTGLRLSNASVAQRPGSNSPLVGLEQFQIAFGGADDERSLLDDGARDGDNARGLRQSRGQGVKACRPRRKRAISRLARTKRNLGLLPFRQLDIRSLFQALRIDACLVDRFVPPHALQRLRGTGAQHVDVLVIVSREFARLVEVDLKKPDHLPVGGDRKHEARLVVLPRAGARPRRILLRTARGGFDDDRRQAPHRLVVR